MKSLRFEATFKRDLKRATRRGCDCALLENVVDQLRAGTSLETQYHDHPLRGEWRSFRECHIKPDWLLIYRTTDTEVRLARTGTHADIFDRYCALGTITS